MSFFISFILAFIINFQLDNLNETKFFINPDNLCIENSDIRKLNLCVTSQEAGSRAEELGVNVGEIVAVDMLQNNYSVSRESLNNINKSDFIKLRNKLYRFHPKQFRTLSSLYENILKDVKYFPIPKSTGSTKWIYYSDSWWSNRNYKKERFHEGTDLMCGENTPGLYPIVSVSDGTVTKLGWLELGGYRIGITSDNGIYYYYAHLDSYAGGLNVGSRVEAGQLIGFCGNTGYSKVVGTKGKFDVHLHFGIYYTDNDHELALNPFYILKNVENNLLYYQY